MPYLYTPSTFFFFLLYTVRRYWKFLLGLPQQCSPLERQHSRMPRPKHFPVHSHLYSPLTLWLLSKPYLNPNTKILTQPPNRYPIVFFIPLEYYSICELNWFLRQQRWTSLWNFKILLSEKKFLKDSFDIRRVLQVVPYFFLLHFLGARVNEGEKNNSSCWRRKKREEYVFFIFMIRSIICFVNGLNSWNNVLVFEWFLKYVLL